MFFPPIVLNNFMPTSSDIWICIECILYKGNLLEMLNRSDLPRCISLARSFLSIVQILDFVSTKPTAAPSVIRNPQILSWAGVWTIFFFKFVCFFIRVDWTSSDIDLNPHLKVDMGWMIQGLDTRGLIRDSFMKAFFDPNSFIASRLSVGPNMFWSWFFTHPDLNSLLTEVLRKWFSVRLWIFPFKPWTSE